MTDDTEAIRARLTVAQSQGGWLRTGGPTGDTLGPMSAEVASAVHALIADDIAFLLAENARLSALIAPDPKENPDA